MKRRRIFSLTLMSIAAVLRVAAAEPQVGENPADHLPRHISQVTWFGERADWSHDGRKILFLTKTFGDAMEIDLATRRVRNLTGHYPHHGYARALYLASGGILLSGPEQFDPKRIGEARVQCWLYVLDKGGTRPAAPLGTKCSEGPAVSRRRMHIAWTHVAAEYPDEMSAGSSRMLEADIVFEDGKPRLALDGGGAYERLTHFSDYPGFKASNPVVSDDGRFITFQMAKTREAAGVGHGIFLYDIEKAKQPHP